jgi:hypothetical protein
MRTKTILICTLPNCFESAGCKPKVLSAASGLEQYAIECGPLQHMDGRNSSLAYQESRWIREGMEPIRRRQ